MNRWLIPVSLAVLFHFAILLMHNPQLSYRINIRNSAPINVSIVRSNSRLYEKTRSLRASTSALPESKADLPIIKPQKTEKSERKSASYQNKAQAVTASLKSPSRAFRNKRPKPPNVYPDVSPVSSRVRLPKEKANNIPPPAHSSRAQIAPSSTRSRSQTKPQHSSALIPRRIIKHQVLTELPRVNRLPLSYFEKKRSNNISKKKSTKSRQLKKQKNGWYHQDLGPVIGKISPEGHVRFEKKPISVHGAFTFVTSLPESIREIGRAKNMEPLVQKFLVTPEVLKRQIVVADKRISEHNLPDSQVVALVGIDADVTHGVVRLANQDPYLRVKTNFIEETKIFREKLSTSTLKQNLKASKEKIFERLLSIWNNSNISIKSRKRQLFNIWDSVYQGDSILQNEAGEYIRMATIQFILTYLPKTSEDRYTVSELKALQRNQVSKGAFDPYSIPK